MSLLSQSVCSEKKKQPLPEGIRCFKEEKKGGGNPVSGWVTLAEKARRIPHHPPFLEASAETYSKSFLQIFR